MPRDKSAPDIAISIRFDNKQLIELIREMPKVFNQEMNAAMRTLGGQFTRQFTKASLRGGKGIKIRKKRAIKRKGGRIFAPADMRRIGFRATHLEIAKLDGKGVRIRSRSPVVHGHEVARPRIFFLRQWGQFEPKAMAIIEKRLERAVRRLNEINTAPTAAPVPDGFRLL